MGAGGVDFTNEFRVGVPLEQAWAVLTTVERIAPCMPGAELTGVEGDTYHGTIKIKVGPVTAMYKGVASFEEKDADARRAVLLASGRETRGQGNASARIVAQLEPDGEGTLVAVRTELKITGKVAQFGRGIIADVSDKLLQTFAANLETELAAGSAPAADQVSGTAPAAADPGAADSAPAVADPAFLADPASADPVAVPELADFDDPAAFDSASVAAAQDPGGEPAVAERREVEPIDLMQVAGGAVLKRALPVVVLAVVVVVAVLLLLL